MAQTSSPVDLGEVVVSAQRPATQTLIDRKVYNVASDLQGTTGTAADVLNQIPSVDVDIDGNVSLRGDGNVTILLDGKPSAQFTGALKGLSLQQLSAREIDRIEVMSTPPSRFKAEGSGGIINIVTKKTLAAGVSGSVQANAGSDNRYIIGGDLADNIGKLKLSGGVTLRQDVRVRQTTDDRTLIDPVSGVRAYSLERLDEHLRRLISSLKTAADYQVDKSRAVGITLSQRGVSSPQNSKQFYESEPSLGAQPTSTERLGQGREPGVDTDVEAHLYQKLRKPDETLDFSIKRSVSLESEHYNYTSSSLVPAQSVTFDRLDIKRYLTTDGFSLDYHLPLPSGRDLKLGYDYEDDDGAFDNAEASVDPTSGALIEDPSLSDRFRDRQSVNAAYGEFEASWRKWTLQSGLRLEVTDVRTEQITGSVDGHQSYAGVYPSLHLDRSLPDQQTLSFSVSRRITRPDSDELDPFVDSTDVHNLRAGNSSLRPQDTWSYELAYESAAKPLSWGLTGYLRDNKDSVTTILQPVTLDVVLATLTNLPRSRAAGLEATANGKLGANFTYSLSANAFYSSIDADGLVTNGGMRSTTGVNGKANLDWHPTPIDAMQVSFSRTDRRLTPQGYITAINLVNLGYRRQILPQLALVSTVTDLFDGQRSQRLVATATLNEDYQRFQIGRVAYVGFVFSFGGGKAKPYKFDYDR